MKIQIVSISFFLFEYQYTISTGILFKFIHIIIMVISKCYFSRKHIALSFKNGVNIKLEKPID